MPICLGKKSSNPGDANFTPYTVPIQPAHYQGDLYDIGGAHFDREQVFPCHAIFLDDKYCLLLRLNNDGFYTRVGAGWIYSDIPSFCERREIIII